MTQRTKRFRFSRRCHYEFHALLMNIHSPPRHPLTSGARNAPKCKGCLGTICKGCHGPEQLEAQGWIAARWGTSANNRKARFYTLTQSGRKQLVKESTRWRRLSTAIGRILGPEAKEG